ncbi:MAG: hypothetical protein AAGJ52_00350 [Pseudomonadota bacterium]
MTIHPPGLRTVLSHREADPLSCRLESVAFKQSLLIQGLGGDELEACLGAARSRPDWPVIAARQPIIMGLQGDLHELPDLGNFEPVSGGSVALQSDHPGQARIDPKVTKDDQLLPQPLNLLFAQQWARLGLFPLHAAALRWRDSGLLLLGPQGAGKSSLVMAALAEGGQVISDDWLLVGGHQGGLRAERLREFLMFREGPVWRRFIQPIRSQSPLDTHLTQDRRPVHVIAKDDPRFPAWTPINRVVVLSAAPEPRPQRSVIETCLQSQLIASLVGSAMPILLTRDYPAERDRLLHSYDEIARQLPTARACSGRDLLESPAAVLDRLCRSDS